MGMVYEMELALPDPPALQAASASAENTKASGSAKHTPTTTRLIVEFLSISAPRSNTVVNKRKGGTDAAVR